MTKLSKKYVWFGVGGTVVQYGLPLSYIIYRYDIFKSDNAMYQLTGWGIIAVGIIGFLLRNKIKAFVDDYNTHLGGTAQRGKWGLGFLTLGGLLALSSLWINGMLWFMLVAGGSNLLSLLFYAPYDKKHAEYKIMKDLQNKTLLESKAGVARV